MPAADWDTMNGCGSSYALLVGNECYLWFAGDNYCLVNETWTGAMTIGLARWAIGAGKWVKHDILHSCSFYFNYGHELYKRV
jgi:hypothetical protein